MTDAYDAKNPEHVKVKKDVLVDFCPIGQQFDHQINDASAEKNKQYVDALGAWRKAFDGDISIYSYYRKYAWDSLPVIIPHYMQKDLQWYATVPVQGVSSYSEPADWFTYELNHYVLAALAWNPNVDVDALIKKFCDARYGDASPVAQSTFAALEKIVHGHAAHLRVAWVYLHESPSLDEAVERMGTTLQRFAVSVGQAEKYSTPTTVYWMLQVAAARAMVPDAGLDAVLRAYPRLLDKNLIRADDPSHVIAHRAIHSSSDAPHRPLPRRSA